VSPESKAAESQTKRVVRVGVSNNNPVGIHGNGGPPSGLVIDIIEDIAKHEGWQLKYVETIWPNLMKLLKNGGIDLLGGMAYTGKRAKQFDFSSEVVISNWGVLYKNKSTIIDGIVDVAGKKIALIPKGVHTVALKRTADSFGLKYQSLPAKGYGHTLEMVSSGEADVGVVSRTFHISHGHKYTALPTNVILNPVKLMFAAPLGKGGGLLDRIDVHLKRQKNDPKSVYSMSTQRWFSVSPREEIPRWLYWLIGSVIVAALVAWVQNIWLKSLVQKRTAELQSAYDNTEKSIQERTLQLRDEVEERRRTEVALVEARENADVANQAKSNFLSQMSHELRTPLNAILGFGQLLLMNPKEDVSNKQKEYIDDIIMSGGLLLDLINQVLDLSRIEAGKVDLKIEDVPIEELLNECVILITPTADEKSVTVNLDMDSGIVNSVRTDYVRLKEVILNLLSNAVKYNKPKGTVQISVNIQDRKFVRFSVADTGVGFRLDDHEKIFLPFNRLDTIKRKEEGTGIGLAITKNLVTLMNGKIGVESEVGVGSKFWVDIPAASR
jgi:signal transduction histidine kinase